MTMTIELAGFTVDDVVTALGLAWRIRPSWRIRALRGYQILRITRILHLIWAVPAPSAVRVNSGTAEADVT
jgi:hypothetical protein